MCNHLLDPNYPGRYCIYCSDPVGEMGFEEGQIFLEDREKRRKYLAVIHKGQQKPVDWVDPGTSIYRIRFKGGSDEVSGPAGFLFTAFQNPREVLEI